METQTNASVAPRRSRVLKWSLIIGIMIVLNLFFNYALSVVYKSPDYNDFCKSEQVVEAINTKESCVAVGGQWNANTYPQKPVSVNEIVPAGYCDQNYTCQKNYDSAQKTYDRNVFVTLVVLGVITLAISFGIINEPIAKGLSIGGVFSFVIASMRYWGSADDLIKVFILGVALAALMYLAYKKFGNILQ